MNRRAKIGFVGSAILTTTLTFAALLRAGGTETIRTHTVVIAAMKFTPAEVRINPGDRVIFHNKDLVPHTATAKDPKTFDSGLIKAGESWTLQLAGDPRTVRYACLYHPTMEGSVTVGRSSPAPRAPSSVR